MPTERTLSTLAPSILTASSRLKLWQSVQEPLPHPSADMADAEPAPANRRAAAKRVERVARYMDPPGKDIIFQLYNGTRPVPPGNFDGAAGRTIQRQRNAVFCRQ